MYEGKDRRKDLRASGRFVISYRVISESANADITQTKNISSGGMLLTTNRQFQPGTKLSLEIRLPLDVTPIKVIGIVVDSNEVVKNMLYDTRLSFLEVPGEHKKIVEKTVNFYRTKKQKD